MAVSTRFSPITIALYLSPSFSLIFCNAQCDFNDVVYAFALGKVAKAGVAEKSWRKVRESFVAEGGVGQKMSQKLRKMTRFLCLFRC